MGNEQKLSIQHLVDQNPWWTESAPFQNDHLIQRWNQSALRWTPRLAEKFQWDLNVIYTLRGPRQVGKTTLLRLRIKKLIEEGVEPRRIFYWTCDLVEDREKLAQIIEEYIAFARKFFSDKRLYLFVDEISSVKDWQYAIKYLYDTGQLRNCLVLLTGSHSIDLRRATENLAGRRGEVDKLEDKLPDKILCPMKFAEYAETRSDSIRHLITDLELLSLSKRLECLIALIEGHAKKEIEELKLHSKELRILFDDYIITGGIPTAINSYIKTGVISKNIYDTYIELILRDARRWGANETTLRQILRELTKEMGNSISDNNLAKRAEIGSHTTVAHYVEMLKDSFIVSHVYQLKQKADQRNIKGSRKIYFQDPFIFHSVRSWVSALDPWKEASLYLQAPENRQRLVESVVCNHLIRLMFNLSPSAHFEYSDKVFYWQSRRKRSLSFCFKYGARMAPLHILDTRPPGTQDYFPIMDFQKSGHSYKGVMLTRDSFDTRSTCPALPVHTFLLLI